MRKLLFLFLLSGCSPETNLAPEGLEELNVYYIKDKRTNLIFAYGWKERWYQTSVVGGAMLTNVPCTKEVEVLLK